MRRVIILGKTGIQSDKNAFGALPIQRVTIEYAGMLLRKAYDAGMTFFDTARAYSDSEEKIGQALYDVRDKITIATKTGANNVEQFWKDLDTSLGNLRTDYIDIYQFHNPSFCPKPTDGTGLYEAMEEAKKQGKIRFIGITSHSLNNAREAVMSGLYDTIQFPFSYLSSEKEIELVRLCEEKDVGFIAMKALSGGLIMKSDAAYAWLDQFDNVLPIWGVQRESELNEFISYMKNPPSLTDELVKVIEKDCSELGGEFCRGCGYCMKECPAKIQISLCARMIQLIRRSPSAGWLAEHGQGMIKNIENCTECGQCKLKCPYGLDIPVLLQKNYQDYMNILSGKTTI